MSSRTRRMSRRLIAMTAIVLAMGLIFWASKSKRFRDAVSAAPASQPSISIVSAIAPTTQPVAAAAPAGDQPLVLTTPGVGTTRPAMLAAVMESPTKPRSELVASATRPAVQPVSTQPLVDAKAKVDANRLLDARRILNSALTAGTLSPQDVAAAKQMLSTINATVVFSSRRFPDDEFGGVYNVKPRDVLQKIAAENDVTWELLCRLNGLSDPRKLRAGQAIKLVKGPVNALISKKDFTLELYIGTPGEAGSVYLTSFPVGLGKDDSTPKGTWMVEPHNKLKNPAYYGPRGEGVIAADDPKNPLGEYWIGLSGIDGHAAGKKSYGIHGTIDPSSIGKMESMGCIRLKNEDAAQVYEMLVEGKSTVVVRD